MKHQKHQYQKGNALIIVMLLFVVVSLSISMGLIAPTVSAVRSVKDNLESKRSYAIAESGVEDVFYRLRTAKQVSSTEIVVLGDQQSTTTVTDITGGKKQINAVGDSNDRNRIINVIVQQGTGASFVYGMQSGQGGIAMANGSKVDGSIYANGPIVGSGTIVGSATSANSAALYADQQNGTGTPANDILFGNTSGSQDIAQSFVLSQTQPVNKVQLYLKKIGSPSNLTARLVTDASGSPSSTTIASGTLSASSVSTSYTWTDLTFSSTPQLIAGTLYWLVLDGSTSPSKYYSIGGDTGYANGSAKTGQYSGTWGNTSPSGLDTYFKVYLGGVSGLVDGITVGYGTNVGNAYANTINGSTVAGVVYCQTGSGNNKTCDTSLADPVAVDMPISDANIQDWKDIASAGGVYSGNYTLDSATGSLGPQKVNGNLSVINGSELTLTGTIWVTGNVDINNNAKVGLASWYGTSSGVIIVDGTVTIGNNSNFTGSGSSESYIMILSTSSSTSAITLSNNAGAVMLYAANGTVNVDNNAGASSINGYKINLSNNAVITYKTGLANTNFVNGPGGSWSATSWREQ